MMSSSGVAFLAGVWGLVAVLSEPTAVFTTLSVAEQCQAHIYNPRDADLTKTCHAFCDEYSAKPESLCPSKIDNGEELAKCIVQKFPTHCHLRVILGIGADVDHPNASAVADCSKTLHTPYARDYLEVCSTLCEWYGGAGWSHCGSEKSDSLTGEMISECVIRRHPTQCAFRRAVVLLPDETVDGLVAVQECYELFKAHANSLPCHNYCSSYGSKEWSQCDANSDFPVDGLLLAQCIADKFPETCSLEVNSKTD